MELGIRAYHIWFRVHSQSLHTLFRHTVPRPLRPIAARYSVPLPPSAMGAPMTIEQMQVAMQEMHTELTNVHMLQRDGATMIVALQAAAAAGGAPPARIKGKAPMMATYDGSKGLDEWFLALRQQDAWYGLATEAERLDLAHGYLAGAALSWLESPAGVLARGDWALFAAGLKARFQPITSEELARAKIFAIVQGSSTVHAYVSAFNGLLAALPAQDEATMLHNFLRGLKPAIREQIRISGTSTYLAAQEKAVRIGSPLPVASSSAGGDAMDLTAMKASSTMDSGDLVASITHEVLAAIQRQSVRSHGSGTGAYRGAPVASSSGAPRLPRSLPTHDGLSSTDVKAYLDAGK
jgi:hypothetical protein